MKHLGKQYFIEIYNCNSEKLNDTSFIEQMMLTAAIKAGATVVQQFFHEFSPYGVSGTVVIAESHINIHTWPEHRYAAVDIFTCGEDLRPDQAVEFLAEALESTKHRLQSVNRGNLAEIQDETDINYSNHSAQ